MTPLLEKAIRADMEAVAYAIRSRGADLTKEHVLEYLREFSRAVLVAALADDEATVEAMARMLWGELTSGSDIPATWEHGADRPWARMGAQTALAALRRHILGDQA